RNSEFYNLNITTSGSSFINMTNCLFHRDGLFFYNQVRALNFSLVNSTFYNGILVMLRADGQNPTFWTVKNTAFEGTAFAWNDNFNGDTDHTAFDYNSYNTN